MNTRHVHQRIRPWIAALLAWSCATTLAAAPTAQLVNPRKHLVLDTRIIAETHNLRLVLGSVEKDPRNPLFPADKPWENSLNNLYPNIAYDERDGLFKLWYKDMLCDREVIDRMMPPRILVSVGWFLLYAASRDGVVWQKPELGLVGFDGSTRNNVVARDTANTGVFLDRHEPDPARRFKMVHDEGRGQLRVRFSADGLRWTEAVTPSIVGAVGDTHNNAFYDERAGRYVLITRLFQGERKVARSESRDFTNWTDARVILESLPGEKGRRQTYCMPAFPYANVYLGFLMLINTGSDTNVDCELTWSPDTVSWHRVNPGSPFIPHGPPGSYDAGCIYAQAGPPVLQDGRLMLFYGGSRQLHIGRKRHGLPCLARLRVDGFAGYEPAAGGQGRLTTQPLRCVGEPLRLSADAQGGSIRVAVLGQAGFELDRCRPIVGHVSDANVDWEGGQSFAALAGKTVRLQFELDAARLYAFSGLER